MNILFSLSNLLILPWWFLMIALPRWRWTERAMRSPLVVVPPALIYATLVVPHLATVWSAVRSPELGGVQALLGTPLGAAAGWAHFVAFDLFVGRWAYLDSRDRGISPWLMAPVLFLVLMMGPLGLLAYLGLRAVVGRTVATPALVGKQV